MFNFAIEETYIPTDEVEPKRLVWSVTYEKNGTLLMDQKNTISIGHDVKINGEMIPKNIFITLLAKYIYVTVFYSDMALKLFYEADIPGVYGSIRLTYDDYFEAYRIILGEGDCCMQLWIDEHTLDTLAYEVRS